jgi:aldose 1-epimerase
MTDAPSGAQWAIASGPWQATVVEVGGGIRELRHGDRDILEPFPVEAICDGGHGAPLIPWPNRLADGRYSFDGAEQQVPLSEPAHQNAIHGFLRWDAWQLVDQSGSTVVVGTRIHPRSGYPFDLAVEIAYVLTHDGLTVTTTAVNRGGVDLPFASGQHPYLSPGNGTVDACELVVPGRSRLVNDDRMLPIGREPAHFAGVIGDLAMDAAFTDLERDANGLAWTTLSCPDGVQVRLWQDETYPYVMVFTGDTLAPSRRRHGLAVEPMTAPPNAFATGDGVRRLGPGESMVSTWGVSRAATP